jgi:plasmid stabilization system protein ParE
MPRLKWTPQSLRDVVRLHDFLAPKSGDAAMRAVKAIRQGVKLLGEHPEMGRPVEDLPEEFREWVIEFGSGAYLVLYRFDHREIVILAIRHGREAGY